MGDYHPELTQMMTEMIVAFSGATKYAQQQFMSLLSVISETGSGK